MAGNLESHRQIRTGSQKKYGKTSVWQQIPKYFLFAEGALTFCVKEGEAAEEKDSAAHSRIHSMAIFMPLLRGKSTHYRTHLIPRVLQEPLTGHSAVLP